MKPENFETRGQSAWQHLQMWSLMDPQTIVASEACCAIVLELLPSLIRVSPSLASCFIARVYNMLTSEGQGVNRRLRNSLFAVDTHDRAWMEWC